MDYNACYAHTINGVIRENSFQGEFVMENKKMQTTTTRLAYETPCIELMCWDEDILMASTDVGEEYPEYWG